MAMMIQMARVNADDEEEAGPKYNYDSEGNTLSSDTSMDYDKYKEVSIWSKVKGLLPCVDGGLKKKASAIEYHPICSIPFDEVEGVRDPYMLFRYLAGIAEDKNYGLVMETYKMLSIDDEKFDFMVEQMVDMDCMDLVDELGQTITHIATQYLDTTHLERLINAGADPNAEDCYGFTPIFYAAISNNVPAAEALIKLNCNILHLAKRTGRMAIHIAAQHGSLDVLKLLLDQGIDMDVLDSVRQTPMILAAYCGKSDVCAHLVEEGSNARIEDDNGIMGIMRIAATMPTITREVLDKFVSEDAYQGERYYHLDGILGKSSDCFCSVYHYFVWLGNMGLVEHPIFERVTNAKWDIYGSKQAKINFTFLAIFLTTWSMIYVEPYSNIQAFKDIDIYYVTSGVIATAIYFIRLVMNGKILYKKWLYMNYLKKLFGNTYKWETETMHFKGAILQSFLKKKYASKQITFAKDALKSPTILFDFVVDNLLFLYLLIKLVMFIYDPGFVDNSTNNSTINGSANGSVIEARRAGGGGKQPSNRNNTGLVLDLDALEKITVWTDLYGAFAIIVMWLSAFIKLQITDTGPFVIYMKAVGKDLATIGTMFIFLFVPAACVFYKTIYINSDKITWYEVLFTVTRMSLIDYDYDGGLALSVKYPIWWLIMSLIWIIVASLIILNLLIALMADSYGDTMESSELQARMEKARFLTQYERAITSEQAKEFDEMIRNDYSPDIVTFDPVCDVDKIDVIKDQVDQLKNTVLTLQRIIEKNVIKELEAQLDEIDDALSMYTSNIM